jgi:hypothetical protein
LDGRHAQIAQPQMIDARRDARLARRTAALVSVAVAIMWATVLLCGADPTAMSRPSAHT